MTPAVSDPARVALHLTEFGRISGWEDDDLDRALDAFRRSAEEILAAGSAFSRPIHFGGSRRSWLPVCEAARSTASARTFFERWFMPFRVDDARKEQGLFTGYFEPEVKGSRIRTSKYTIPIYGKPSDLVAFDAEEQKITGLAYGRREDSAPLAYFSRKQIERGALSGRNLELCWLASPEDAFFIHVQGSGRVRFDDESIVRLSFAAKSGRPYTSIGALLVERGVIAHDEMSMQSIRAWMASNPEDARQLMWENRSFIFFREANLADPDLGAFGAQHIQLTPRRSIAVDRTIWAYGTPIWLDCSVPSPAASPDGYFRSLTVAQDTGSAIIGGARADVFWGFGDEAGAIAGQMKGTGSMTVLLPSAVAGELGLV